MKFKEHKGNLLLTRQQPVSDGDSGVASNFLVCAYNDPSMSTFAYPKRVCNASIFGLRIRYVFDQKLSQNTT